MRPEFALAFFLFSASALAQKIPSHEPWKLVAKSDLIIVGTPSVPLDQVEEAQRSGKDRYIEIPVRIKDCLKGDPCPETAVVRDFTGRAWYDVPSQTLVESSGNQSVFFLTYVDTQTITGLPEIYFVQTPKALQPYSEKVFREVTAEVLAQKEIIKQFGRNFRPEDDPSHVQVRSVIEKTLNRRTEKQAFAQLEAWGEAAVPLMIMFMDDRRELPIQEISLRNGPGGFELFRVYGPKVVADAIAAILNQITQEDFGTIVHGGSERERRAAIDGWRIYLHRKRFGTSKPPG